MRRKLLLLSALTCITGGTALLTPTAATSQSRAVICEDYLGKGCTTIYKPCTRASGVPDYLICDINFGFYVWA
jgi:hypothetical protein